MTTSVVAAVVTANTILGLGIVYGSTSVNLINSKGEVVATQALGTSPITFPAVAPDTYTVTVTAVDTNNNILATTTSTPIVVAADAFFNAPVSVTLSLTQP